MISVNCNTHPLIMLDLKSKKMYLQEDSNDDQRRNKAYSPFKEKVIFCFRRQKQ